MFLPPSWVPKLPEVPDSVSIPDFILNEGYGRCPINEARPFFTCGLSGKSYSAAATKERVELLARGIGKELGWSPNKGSEWDKVAGVFAPNTLDTIILAWAIQKLGGIDTPANAAYSAFELEHQLRDSGASCVFTCQPLLDTTLKVTEKLGIPKHRVFLLEMPKEATDGSPIPAGFKTVSDIVKQGSSAPPLESLKWSKGQGGKQVAFLCYSSGTSGLPKGVMISHRNVIANTMQIGIYDSVSRSARQQKQSNPKKKIVENVLGLLPMSHIYGLVVICHASLYLGDGIVVLPKFEFKQTMKAVQDHKVNSLYLVPPIIIVMVNNKPQLDQFDLSSVKGVFTGAAPLGKETAENLLKMYPHWDVRQGYGLTETCTVVTSSGANDIWLGSCGSLIPGYEARLVTPEGQEITGYDQPGELQARGPSVTLGYLHNEKANKETFIDGFMCTGDEAVVRKSPNGHEHFFIVDRIKELIKVKGLQVAPAELEAHLLAHEAVDDCAVIPIPDDAAGERPKAYVVKSAKAGGLEDSPRLIMRDIQKHVEKDKARHKWLKEVEFIDAIPKSPSGKILRRMLRDKDREGRKRTGAKL
ncbi:MAG: hypothetical protein M1828_000256 [Chrysothrix sp. TS-e1954]|nr:MAG: hypothetical protein M1828_000256 [Chrysothrix sp. TS-e1954]